MFLRSGLLGDAVVVSSGKWSLIGQFNLIWGREFPMVWPQMGILIHLETDRRYLGKHELHLVFVNEMGERLSGEPPPQVPFTFEEPHTPGFPIQIIVGVDYRKLKIPAPGKYGFIVRVDDTYIDSIPLYVRDLKDLPGPEKGS